MKRILSLLLLLTLLPLPRALAAGSTESAGLPIAAPSAILMEKETGQTVYEKNADERLFPASVTKVMTLLLILEDLDAGKLSLDDTVTASARAASFGGSCVYLEQGERMSVHEMIKCIAVVSANDCAVAMAEHLAGSESVFVERMNRRAEELGLKNTHFTNCTGLFEDPEHYTSARDVALMSRELLRHPRIKDYSSIWMDSIRGGAFELTNTNKLVRWYEGCTGLKTGFTSQALYCVSATAERNGLEFIAVVMHGETSDSRNSDATTLLNYGFAHYMLCPLSVEGGLPGLPVELGRAERVQLETRGAAYALLPRSGTQPEYRLELPEAVRAPVERGQELGTLHVTAEGREVAALPLVAAEEVPALGFGGLMLLLAGRLLGM